jgi:omega-amidase
MPGSKTLRVAAFQFDVTTDPDLNRAAVDAGLVEASGRGVELVVLPELWAGGFPDGKGDAEARQVREEETVAWLAGRSAELGLCVGGTSLVRKGDRVYNRLDLFEVGEERLAYDKVHLFTPTAEHEVCAAGERPPATVEVAGARVSGVICYDLRFPELFRVPFRDGVQVLMIPAQWPSPRDAHWRALVIARAVESQCFVVACNRTGRALIGRRGLELDFPGNSLVVSPHGEVLAEGRGETTLVQADLELDQVRSYRTRVPVHKDERPDLYRSW